jgi:hypothetical protein
VVSLGWMKVFATLAGPLPETSRLTSVAHCTIHSAPLKIGPLEADSR